MECDNSTFCRIHVTQMAIWDACTTMPAILICIIILIHYLHQNPQPCMNKSVPIIKFESQIIKCILPLRVSTFKLPSSSWLNYISPGLRHEPSSPSRILGSWVWIPLEAWISACVCSCDGLIPVQGVVSIVYRLRNWKVAKVHKGYRDIDR
jgi:hypothetical protein